MDERKRPYNSLRGLDTREPTEEEMESAAAMAEGAADQVGTTG